MRKGLPWVLGILVLVFLGMLAQRLWLSPEARERTLTSRSREQLEREAGKDSSEPLLFYVLARRRLEDGDAPGAAEALETALRLRPRFARARATLGTVLMSLDRDSEAALQLRQAAQDDPTLADAYLGLALLYRRNEAWKLQADAAQFAVQLEPGQAEAWILWGEAVAHQGDHARAAECYERAAQIPGAEARGRALASGERLTLGELDRAQQLAEEAVRLEPKFPLGHTALGNVLMRRSPPRGAEAEKAYAAAASLGDDSGQAHLGLGRALQRLERPTEAEQQFRLAIRAHPELAQAHYGLAQSLRRQGKNEAAAAAEQEFRKWVRFQQESSRLHDELARTPQDVERWFKLARLYARMGLKVTARRLALSGLRRAPASSEGKKLLEEIDRDAG